MHRWFPKLRLSLLLVCFTTQMHLAWSISLAEAEAIAMENNPQIKKAEALVERAKQGRTEAFSKWLPQLFLLSQAFRTQKPLSLIRLNEPSAFITQISLTQTLFSEELRHNVKIAALINEQFDHILEAAKNDILYQVRILYYLVALDHNKIKTAKENIELLNYLARRMEGKYRIGEATAYDVNQARVAISNVTDAYYQNLKQLKNHQDELAQVLGFDPAEEHPCFDQEEIPIEDIPDLACKFRQSQKIFSERTILKDCFFDLEEKWLQSLFPEEEYALWENIANSSRPDIKLSHTLLSIADETIKSKRGAYWPKLSLVGGYGGNSTPYVEQASTRFTNQQFRWALGVSLEFNIFDGLARESRIRQAKAEERSAYFEAQKILQSAHTEVREQIYSIEKGLSKLLTSTANLTLAEQTLEQAKSRLDIGYVTIYDYLISVDGLIRAKTAQDEGKFELLSAYYGLLHASGRN